MALSHGDLSSMFSNIVLNITKHLPTPGHECE
jgi:hypothetical protein